MCGLYGLTLSEPVDIPEQVSGLAAESLKHRGPDGGGVWRRPGALLGMRRLAIIDPSGPPPPYTNESQRFICVGNGEIYSHADIRKRLETQGHRFSSGNDLEVIPHLAEDARPDWELGLRGMFAFAVWDETDRKLHLARDRFGIKPLFWTGNEDGIAFASTLPALRAMLRATGRDDWRVDARSLSVYLDLLAVPSPHTFFENVYSLPPGHRLIWSPGECPRIERYWSPQYTPKRKISLAQALRDFEEIFSDSVRHHLVSDVPVGAFLSGGIDSSLVVAESAKLIGSALKTYTVGFAESEYSEIEAAREIARKLHTEHEEICLDPFHPDDVRQLVRGMNQPLGDSSAWPTWAISRVVAGGRKVALAGEGGDELWGGYPYYATANLSRFLPKNSLPLAEDSFSAARGSKLGRRWRDAFRSPQALYRRWRQLDPIGTFRRDIALDPDQFPIEDGLPPLTAGLDAHEQFQLADVQGYLPNDLLEKVDTMSMAHGLEVRVPWLDPVLFDWVAHLPVRHKINGGSTKWLARKLVWKKVTEGTLPASILDRPKQGFAIPVHRWMARELVETFQDTALATDSRLAGRFDVRAMRRWFEAHRAGDIRAGHSLWALLVLDLWLRETGVGL